MKKLSFPVITLIFFLLSIQSIFGVDQNTPDDKGENLLVSVRGDDEILEKLFSEMGQIILASNNELLQDIYKQTSLKINQGHLKLTVRDKIENQSPSKIGNAVFQYNFNSKKGSNPEISIERKLLRFYPKNKSLIMGVLIHELTHAYFYFTDHKAFLANRESQLETYLYEMDAIYAEAMLFTLCKGKGSKILKFEEFLIESNKNNNLAVASIKLFQTDNELVWELIHFKNAVIDKKATHKDFFDFIQKQGEDILTRWDSSNKFNKWERYRLCVELLTFNSYIGVIANQCLTSEIINDLSKEIGELQSLQDRIYRLANSNYDIVLEYQKWFYDDLFSDIK